MTQKISPFIEAKFGWDFGEGGWNTGADENWLKFSFLFDANVDSISATLPAVVNGAAHFLTTDNRFYFGVGSVWYSTPCPKNFIFKIKSTGEFFQFDGTVATSIDNPGEIEARFSAIELTVSQLGSAAFEDSSTFATVAALDVVSGQAAAYTDNLESRLLTGDADVGFTQSGSGAVLRTVEEKARERVTAEDFSGTDGESINSAINSLFINGGEVSLTKRGYSVSDDGSGSGISLSLPVSIEGTGGVYSSISDTGVSSEVSTLHYSPSVAFDHSLVSVERLHFGNPSTGTRSGDVGILLTTLEADQNLAKYTIRDVIVGQGVGPGVAHSNDPVANANGGLYCARFENSQIKGGIRLESSGDSNTISHCVMSGSGIGVDASLVSGASLLAIENCNITTSGGAIRINAGSRFRILGNNIEHMSPGASDAAVINIAGANGTMSGGAIRENLVSTFAASDATRLVRLSNCIGTVVEGNVFLRGTVTTEHAIVIDSNCVGVRIGSNVFSTGWDNPIVDNGIGTMGIVKTASLLNGWVPFTANETIRFIKSVDGIVTLFGTVKDGTTTSGTPLFTLPVGFRPSTVIRSPCYTYDISGTSYTAQVIIDTDGSVLVSGAHAAQLSLNSSFPAELISSVQSSV